MIKKKSISEEVKGKYKDNNYENSGKLSFSEATSLHGCEECFYDELDNCEIKGYPFASAFVDANDNKYTMSDYYKIPPYIKKQLRLKYYFLPKYHELYIGTTGSGKTTGCVEPQLRAIVKQKNKPNIFVTDPKGELFNHNAEFMKKNGYKLFVLNFKDLRHSDSWNPLDEIYGLYEKKKQIEEFSKSLLSSRKRKFVYSKQTFNSKAELQDYLDFETSMINSSIDYKIKQLAEIILPVMSTKDPSWEYGAQNLLEGIIYIMLRQLDIPESGFTHKMFTLKTLFSIYDHLKLKFVSSRFSSNATTDDLKLNPLIGDDTKILSKVSTVLANAPATKRGYLGVFDSNVIRWRSSHIYSITSETSFDLKNIDTPYAIFVITRDYEKTDYQFAGLFFNYVYTQVLEEADEKIKFNQQPKCFHFILDEFANIPKIPDLDIKIATARSRNIWLHLYVQSYEQIANTYPNNSEASVIVSNCNNVVFLGSQSHESIEKFSVDCGKKTITNIDNHRGLQFIEVKVLQNSELDQIEEGMMYSKRIYTPVICTNFIRSYVLGETGYFDDFKRDGLITQTPMNPILFDTPEYTFIIPEELEDEDDDDRYRF